MDLIGIPVRITIGKKANDGILEIKLRKENNSTECNIDEAINKIEEIINKN